MYMIFVEGGDSPRKVHRTEESARAEAQRLTRQTRRRGYLLRSIDVCEVMPPPITWLGKKDIEGD